MKMQKCPHCSEENKIYARVCSYCMKTIVVEVGKVVVEIGKVEEIDFGFYFG